MADLGKILRVAGCVRRSLHSTARQHMHTKHEDVHIHRTQDHGAITAFAASQAENSKDNALPLTDKAFLV